jgi:hypothetical protein
MQWFSFKMNGLGHEHDNTCTEPQRWLLRVGEPLPSIKGVI